MKKQVLTALFLSSVFMLAMVGASNAQDVGKNGKPLTWPQQRMKTCGNEWKEAKKADATLKGRDKWEAFRSDCFKRHPKPATDAAGNKA